MVMDGGHVLFVVEAFLTFFNLTQGMFDILYFGIGRAEYLVERIEIKVFQGG